jgi:hypothetical protein
MADEMAGNNRKQGHMEVAGENTEPRQRLNSSDRHGLETKEEM